MRRVSWSGQRIKEKNPITNTCNGHTSLLKSCDFFLSKTVNRQYEKWKKKTSPPLQLQFVFPAVSRRRGEFEFVYQHTATTCKQQERTACGRRTEIHNARVFYDIVCRRRAKKKKNNKIFTRSRVCCCVRKPRGDDAVAGLIEILSPTVVNHHSSIRRRSFTFIPP